MQINIINKFTVPALILGVFGLGSLQAYHTYDNHKNYTLNSNIKHSAHKTKKVEEIKPVTLALFNAPQKAAPGAAKKAPLVLDISAIVYSDKPGLSIATINQAGKQVSYREGEKLQGYEDVWIDTIEKNSIQVRYKDDMETVQLKNPDYIKGVDTTRVLPVKDTKLVENHLGDYFILGPEYKSSDKLVGLKITPKSASDIFKKAGLNPGDIVVKINSNDVTGNKEIKSVIDQWAKLDSANITVKRGGEDKNIHLDLQIL
ncbi:PDZ domain-containing protein [Budviciaceae bacterium BWR-B9]|uniref:PDZ domain-containing protein n=1 Tax=Limnobaculum allomyrinae TaxID=2791986 RepID=A0ABS1IUM1_9GAMM|nr:MULTISPECIES: PDZ domain-containing protein [Limnobaculum]MBK5145231.1 PDZ domain-containing protein [Limnobaculum allomyrinae]MBV7693063.1 PDZ domain-containing protein [Limnobaculum sp. M2-1]